MSRFGLVAFASSLDQIGPLTKDVTDAALVLNLIAGHDEMDSTSLNVPETDYTAGLCEDITGLRIGVPESISARDLTKTLKADFRGDKIIRKPRRNGEIF